MQVEGPELTEQISRRDVQNKSLTIKTLQSHGFVFSNDGAYATLTSTGLRWLMNYAHQRGSSEPEVWNQGLLRRLAQFQPEMLRGLNLTAIELKPYGDMASVVLLAYLDKTPPNPVLIGQFDSGGDIELTINPGLGLKYSQSISGCAMLDLNEHEKATLKSGGTLRID